jgi:AcrR family transcriptional regulator
MCVPLIPSHRARQPEQKEERRKAILQAAHLLWTECTFEQFTMSHLAQRLGLAKGTLYLYFETKEELFLALLDELLEAWLGELAVRFRRLRRPVSARALALAVSASLESRRELVRLLPLVETLLDRGASDQAALAFEQRMLQYLGAAGAELESCFSSLPAGSGVRLLLLLRALIMGMYLRANRPPRIARILADQAGLQAFNVQFDEEFVFGTEALIAGFLKLSGRGTNLKVSS